MNELSTDYSRQFHFAYFPSFQVFSDDSITATHILLISKLEAQYMMLSQIRSHTEYLIPTEQ